MCYYVFFFFFKQKTAYEMRISDWSSDVCSSDLFNDRRVRQALNLAVERRAIAERLLAIGNPPAWGVVPPRIAGSGGGYRPEWADWPRARRLAEARRQIGRAPCRERVCQYV